jgi:hypothetical protein
MGLIPILLIVVLILLLARRGKRHDGSAMSVSGSMRDPIRLLLLIVLVLVVIVLIVNLFAPLGNYRVWSR